MGKEKVKKEMENKPLGRRPKNCVRFGGDRVVGAKKAKELGYLNKFQIPKLTSKKKMEFLV